MNSEINIVIPSVQLSTELIYCLKKLNNQTYKNFFVTIVLDFNNKIKLPKLKYKLNTLISRQKNMSYKRNLGVKKFKSDLIAFLDSDAYPHKNWLKTANNFTSKNLHSKTIFGGPSIPFPKQRYTEMLCHYAKRSFYVTGYLNFRKYKSKSRYCDWIEACCMFMNRDLYLKNGGMNIKKYLGEDKELIQRMKQNDSSVKVFFTSKLFIYHKERSIKKFLLQKMVFGSDLFNIVRLSKEIRTLQPILPLLILSLFILLIFINIELKTKLLLMLTFLILVQSIIIVDVIKYLKGLKKIALTLVLINLANIAFATGSFIAFLGLKNLINRKAYLMSRKDN